MDLMFEILKMNVKYSEGVMRMEEGGQRVFFDITREQLSIIRYQRNPLLFPERIDKAHKEGPMKRKIPMLGVGRCRLMLLGTRGIRFCF
jgi:hypothetical protein